MFIYAGAYSIAKANGLPLHFYDFNNFKDVFHITSRLINRSKIEHFRGLKVKETVGYNENQFNISKDSETLLKSFFWSWRYFKKYENDIRKEFSFQPEIMVKAKAILELQTKDNIQRNGHERTTLVGVHVRRGDSVLASLQRLGRVQPPLTFYYKAMDYYKQICGENTLFVYCSDGIKWVKTNLRNVTANYNMVFMDTRNSWAVDMAILTLCDHSVVSSGTFGWWAAYLTGGTVIHYKDIAREGSEIRSWYSNNVDDYLYPGWITME